MVVYYTYPLLLLIFLLLPLPITAAESAQAEMPAATSPLTLQQVIRITLERNLNLRAEQYDTRASQSAVQREYGLYDPQLLVMFSTGESQRQINQLSFEEQNHNQFSLMDVSLTQQLPSGGALTLTFDNQRNEEKAGTIPGINPAYESELGLQLLQPLLKGFGRSVAEQDILFAVNDSQVAVQDLREVAFALLAEVRDAYYELLRLRDDLHFREISVVLAQKILNEASARVRAGVLPPVDILEAEFGLKERQKLQLDADREYRDGLDRLALLMSSRLPVDIADVPLGRPVFAVDEEQGVQLALAKRPDLQRRIRQLERLDLEQRLARNDLLPGLDLTAGYSHKGLGGDYGDDLDDVGNGDYPNWHVGLNLSYPLGNRTARHEHSRTLLRIKGRQAELVQLQEEIRSEIRAAIRLLEVNDKKIEVATSGEAFAEEKLRILIKRQEVGLATIRQVLEGEEDLAQARTGKVASLADYNKAITRYLQVSGQLLEADGVRFKGVSEDESQPLLLIDLP